MTGATMLLLVCAVLLLLAAMELVANWLFGPEDRG